MVVEEEKGEKQEEKIAEGPDTEIQCCFCHKSIRSRLKGDLNLASFLEGMNPVMKGSDADAVKILL